ncbi:flagellar hook-basal body complex protein FliE [Sesbania bispinosa]|nr:flagellar hook-basal body complex protein FliE [Sesbania bispinosa]
MDTGDNPQVMDESGLGPSSENPPVTNEHKFQPSDSSGMTTGKMAQNQVNLGSRFSILENTQSSLLNVVDHAPQAEEVLVDDPPPHRLLACQKSPLSLRFAKNSEAKILSLGLFVKKRNGPPIETASSREGHASNAKESSTQEKEIFSMMARFNHISFSPAPRCGNPSICGAKEGPYQRARLL